MKKLYTLLIALFIAVSVFVSPVAAQNVFARNLQICLYQDVNRNGNLNVGEYWVATNQAKLHLVFRNTSTNAVLLDTTGWANGTYSGWSGCYGWINAPDIGIKVDVAVDVDNQNCIYNYGWEGNVLTNVNMFQAGNQGWYFGWQPEAWGGVC